MINNNKILIKNTLASIETIKQRSKGIILENIIKDDITYNDFINAILKAPANISTFEIPDYIYKLGNEAFKDQTSLKTITIPKNITHIGDACFSGDTSLNNVIFESNHIKFGEAVFKKCTLLKEINLMCMVNDTLPSNFFEGSGITSLNLPTNVTMIDDYCFKKCIHLKTITIPDTIQYIGTDIFQGCTQLETIIIGEGCTDIDINMFNNLPLLTEIYFKCKHMPNGLNRCKFKQGTIFHVTPEAAHEFKTLSLFDDYVILTEGILSISEDGFTEDSTNKHKMVDTSYITDDSVDSLNMHIFTDNKIIKTINLANVNFIDMFAFKGCINLKTVIFSDKLNMIEAYAFKGCINLKSIVIPDSVHYINMGAFEGCTKLSYCKLSNGLFEVPEDCFKGCTSLTEITIPGQIIDIGKGAFKGCTNLKKITLPTKFNNMDFLIKINDIGIDYNNTKIKFY